MKNVELSMAYRIWSQEARKVTKLMSIRYDIKRVLKTYDSPEKVLLVLQANLLIPKDCTSMNDLRQLLRYLKKQLAKTHKSCRYWKSVFKNYSRYGQATIPE